MGPCSSSSPLQAPLLQGLSGLPRLCTTANMCHLPGSSVLSSFPDRSQGHWFLPKIMAATLALQTISSLKPIPLDFSNITLFLFLLLGLSGLCGLFHSFSEDLCGYLFLSVIALGPGYSVVSQMVRMGSNCLPESSGSCSEPPPTCHLPTPSW